MASAIARGRDGSLVASMAVASVLAPLAQPFRRRQAQADHAILRSADIRTDC